MTNYVNFTAAMRVISGRSWKKRVSALLLPTYLGKSSLFAYLLREARFHLMQLTEYQSKSASKGRYDWA
jgi:hypothetical protein